MDSPTREEIELSTGYYVTVKSLTTVTPSTLAGDVQLPLESFLDEVERWSEGPGARWGISVDRSSGTITKT